MYGQSAREKNMGFDEQGVYDLGSCAGDRVRVFVVVVIGLDLGSERYGADSGRRAIGPKDRPGRDVAIGYVLGSAW